MCTACKDIKNNSLSFNTWYDRFKVHVPCGKCDDCLTGLQNGYLVRHIFQFKETQLKHGFALYFTLTYDNEHVPFIEIDGSKFLCFHKCHIQKFLNSLRKVIPNLHYQIVSEYGSKTKRPHYHGIFYCYDITPQEVRYFIKKYWYYGFVNFAKNYGVVYDDSALIYVVKYLYKDIYFKSVLSKIEILLDKKFKDSFFYVRGYRIKNIHYQSVGFGLYGLKCLNDNNYLNGSISYFTSKALELKLNLPLYYYRKKCYDFSYNIHGNVHYFYNDYGKKIFKHKLYKSIKNTCYDLQIFYKHLQEEKKELELIDLLECIDFNDVSEYFCFYKNRSNFLSRCLEFDIDFILTSENHRLLDFDEASPIINVDYDYIIDRLSNFKKSLAYEKYLNNCQNHRVKQNQLELITGKRFDNEILTFQKFFSYV